MRPVAPLPLGVAVILLGFCLLLQVSGKVDAEVGGRHIRRITAADLPSSNSTVATKVRLKKFPIKNEDNCTKAGFCGTSTTSVAETTSRSNTEDTSKTVSSFVADDVLQRRLHSDALKPLATTASSYDGGYESYFDDVAADGFDEKTVHVPKKTSPFRGEYHPETEASNFGATLTTPRISLFDDFHARVTEGIRQNLEDTDEHRFRDVSPAHGNTARRQSPSLVESTERTNESLSLEFSSNFSIVYNDSKDPNSVKRDLVVENGTHVDFEKSRIHTKLQPEINRTIYYISNDTHSTILPALKSVQTIDSKDERKDIKSTDSLKNDTIVELSTKDSIVLGSHEQKSIGYSDQGKVSSALKNDNERSSARLNTGVSINRLQNNTGTPGDKDSTTSEPSRGRSYSRSQASLNYSLNGEKITETSDAPTTKVVPKATKSSQIVIESKNSKKDTLTSFSNDAVVTKDPESNAVAPGSTERATLYNNNRGGRMLVSRRGQFNTTNGLDHSSQTPPFGSSENSFSSDDETKKPRERNTIRRTGTNKSEEQVEASTVSLGTTTEKFFSESSTEVPEDNIVLTHTKSIQNEKNRISGNSNTKPKNVTEEPEASSTVSYGGSSRGRAFSHRRPSTVASTTTRDNEATTKIEDSSESSTSKPTASSISINLEAVRRRLTTLRRRPQTSTEPSVTLTSAINSTTESNTIVRGWPAIARRPSVVAEASSNKTTLTSDNTDNNEGNDIISGRNNLYKSVNRNRGSVRYGTQRNDTSDTGSSFRNETYAFPIPPTAIAWTLVTLKGPSNETRFVRHPVSENNSTSNGNSSENIKSAVAGRWPPTRGRKPWSSEQESTSVGSVVENIGSVITSPKSTKLSPIESGKNVTRVRSSTPSKKVQQSSMQENRWSTVQVVAPTTEQFDEATEKSISTTLGNDDEISTTSLPPSAVTELEYLSTGSENTTENSYKTTFVTAPIATTTPEISTIGSSSVLDTDDIYTPSYFIRTSQVTTVLIPTSTDGEDISTTVATEVPTVSELTWNEGENITTELTTLGAVSVEEVSVSTSIADEAKITTTTESVSQGITSTVPFLTIGSQSGFLEEEIYNPSKKGESERQNNEGQEGESGNNVEPYNGVVNNAGETNNQADENKQTGNNADGNQPEAEVGRPANGDETRVDVFNSDGSYNQGDISGSISEDEENKNPDDNRQLDENQNSGKLPPTSAGGDEPYPANEDSPDYGNPESIVLNHTTSADIATVESTTNHTDTTSPLPGSDEMQTSGTIATEETFTTSKNEQTTTWSSSTSAIEWDADSTTLPSAIGVPFYLIISISASWREFCDHIDQFKQSVVSLMRNNNRPILTYQVMLPNADPTRCQNAARSTRSSTIHVEMYLVNEQINFDRQLTMDFYSFWRNWGLPDSPFEINTVQPEGQTSDDNNDDGGGGGGGMIAAIAISCIGAVCLLLLAVLWLVMRKRQQRFNYGQRCTPVSLDAYSLDSVSVCGSVRRKGVIRNSKRSYGNAGFDDPSSPSHPMGFAGLANFILNRESLEEEFANIPQVTANVDELPEGGDTKNRYANVIPLPETRVQLSPREGEPLSEYINANFVHGPKNASKYYIACQAPLATTVRDFWRMIWEQQSKVVLMLTDLVENGVEKSADYLPPSEVLDCHRLFGDFQITLKKREVKEKYIISTLQLKNLETNSWREVMHLWYMSWPAQGVPDDVSSVTAFLLEARPYMRGGPCVVHCSPGTGRTGTILACDLCIRDFETTRIVDIPRCVARLRRDRAGAVQTRDQYVFIYQVINFYGTKLTGGALDSM